MTDGADPGDRVWYHVRGQAFAGVVVAHVDDEQLRVFLPAHYWSWRYPDQHGQAVAARPWTVSMHAVYRRAERVEVDDEFDRWKAEHDETQA